MSVVLSGGLPVRVQSSAIASMRESITDVSRQVEDLLWVSLSTDTRGLGLDDAYEERRRLLARIRTYRRRHPLAKVGAGLVQHYVLGRGITLKANNKRVVARLVDEFWNHPINKVVFTGHQAMKEAIDTLFTDGQYFMVLFPDETNGTLTLGQIDAMFVEDVINDPDNGKVPRWYKVRKAGSKYDFALGAYVPQHTSDFVYYRDWRNADERPSDPPKPLRADGLIYHAAVNKRGKFGESELAASLDWLKAHKEFMEDRASLNRAAAQIAWKKKRKGNGADIGAEVARLQSSLAQNISRWESNPPNAAAATIVENEGSNMEWVKTDTGGAAASADERVLRMMVGSGMGGVPNHYFGDEASANLATATAMELPLLKTYEDWQQTVGDWVRDLVEYMLNVAHEAGRLGPRDDSERYAERTTTPRATIALASKPAEHPEPPEPPAQPTTAASAAAATGIREAMGPGPTEKEIISLTLIPKSEPQSVSLTATDDSGAIDWYVDVDFPPILSKDITAYVNAMKVLFDLLPATNIESQKLVVEEILRTIGFNDIDQVMTRIFPPDLVSPEVMKGAAAAAGAARAINGPSQLPPRQPGAAPLPGAISAGPPQPNPAPAPAPTPVSEAEAAVIADLARYRVRRVLRATDQAMAAIAEARAAEAAEAANGAAAGG